VLSRLERKLAEVQTWVDSTHGAADWPSAIALALLRTRPARIAPYIWLRPQRLNGLRIRINPSDLSQFVIYEEFFVTRLYDLDRVAFIPDAVVDCGAYAGYFSLLARLKYAGATLLAFEPNVGNFENLVANIRANHLSIEAVPAAVSTSDGTATFSGRGCGGRLDATARDSVIVKVADLRRVISALHSERLLLKLDIEGEEAALLPALLPVLPRHCAIFFEWHHGADAFQDLAAQLTAQGLTTSVTRTNQIDGTTFIDAFAQRN